MIENKDYSDNFCTLHSRLSPNNITRFMNYRILGKDIQKKNVANTARRQQGFL